MEPTQQQPAIFVTSVGPPEKTKLTKNAFFFFRQDFCKTVSEKEQRRVSTLAGAAWRDLKARGGDGPYQEMARLEREAQKKLHPNGRVHRGPKKGKKEEEEKEPAKRRERKRKSVPMPLAPTPSSSSAPMQSYLIASNTVSQMNPAWWAGPSPAVVSGNYLSHMPPAIQDSGHHPFNRAPASGALRQRSYGHTSTHYYPYPLPHVPTLEDLLESDNEDSLPSHNVNVQYLT